MHGATVAAAVSLTQGAVLLSLRCMRGAVYLVNKPQCFLGVEVTLARHICAQLACVMLRDKLRRTALAGVTLTVLCNPVVTVSRMLALLAACSQPEVRVQEHG